MQRRNPAERHLARNCGRRSRACASRSKCVSRDDARRTRTLLANDGADLDDLLDRDLIDSSLTYARFEREQPELQAVADRSLGPWLSEQVGDIRILGASLPSTRHRRLPPIFRGA